MFADINQRARDILREIVECYVETGEPVGSRTISKRMGLSLSPASIRNVMADLTEAGLLYAPHTSAGRLPTEAGLRLFVDGLLQIGELSEEERRSIEAQLAGTSRSLTGALEEASSLLSGLSACAGLVIAPKLDRPFKQVEFVQLGPGRALVVIVTVDGMVENRVIELPPDVSATALIAAGNYLSARLAGHTLEEMRREIHAEIEDHQSQLDTLSAKVVEAGLACWSGEDSGQLIIRGQSRLLNDVAALEDLERIRRLFEMLERQETMLRLVEATRGGDGVQIFIGSDSALFDMTGCSVIITPFRDQQSQILGAIGVVGPTRLNYGRIIPMVDYTAKVVGRMIG